MPVRSLLNVSPLCTCKLSTLVNSLLSPLPAGSRYQDPPRVCILGGGFGGLYTAVKLDSLMWPEGTKPQVKPLHKCRAGHPSCGTPSVASCVLSAD